MSNMKHLSIKLKQAISLDEFKRKEGGRIMGLLYFELLPEGGTISRTITEKTDATRLQQNIKNGIVYLPDEMIVNELG